MSDVLAFTRVEVRTAPIYSVIELGRVNTMQELIVVNMSSQVYTLQCNLQSSLI